MNQLTYKTCQSYAMPLKLVRNKTAKVRYCSDYYQDGQFTDDFKSVRKMQEFCTAKLIEMKSPESSPGNLSRNSNAGNRNE